MIDPALEDSKRLGDMANRLFSGFTKKLAGMRTEALDLHQKIQATSPADASAPWKQNTQRQTEASKLINHYSVIQRRFDSLEPALLKFARQISQRLEHTQIDEIIRIELEARLADFENDVRATRDYITNYIP